MMSIESNGLKTDLYELTMAAGYYQNRHNPQAVFELYCHTMPPNRSYLVACGLEQVLDYILTLRFRPDDTRYLKTLPIFKKVDASFFRYLRNFKFSGDVWALPEGEICFANEPIVQIRAPLIEAQILETYLLSVINIQTSVATKAARVVSAACADGRRRPVVDFGARRAHGPGAAIMAARAAFIGGCLGTSNVHAAREFAMPVFGTMAHSWVEAFESESAAFKRFHSVFPQHTILLVDTYATLAGVKKAAALGRGIRGIRLDSGNLHTLGRRSRRLLDENGLTSVKILASGNLNEYKILNLVRRGCPIDIFGVGTEMVVARDFPALDLTYKLVQTKCGNAQVRYHMKTSAGKHTMPGRKQVFRFFNQDNTIRKDMIGLFDEKPPAGSRPLLVAYIRRGRRVQAPIASEKLKKRSAAALSHLPGTYRSLRSQKAFPVMISPRLSRLKTVQARNQGGC